MNFFQRASVATYFPMQVNSISFMIINDDLANSIEFSYDGQASKGIIRPSEGFDFLNENVNTIYVRDYISGAHANFRIFGYGNGQVFTEKIISNQPLHNEIQKYFSSINTQ